jgi:uncharacterized protein (TIGR03643 family)
MFMHEYEKIQSTALINADDYDRIIQMAWEDRTPFEAIALQFGLNESAVIKLMRGRLKRSSFEMWRERVTGRQTKHREMRSKEVLRFRSSDQKNRGCS